MQGNRCVHNVYIRMRFGILAHCVLENSRPNGLLFSGELLETGGIHNSGYWKIAGLTACYFQVNSWRLLIYFIRVIGK